MHGLTSFVNTTVLRKARSWKTTIERHRHLATRYIPSFHHTGERLVMP